MCVCVCVNVCVIVGSAHKGTFVAEQPCINRWVNVSHGSEVQTETPAGGRSQRSEKTFIHRKRTFKKTYCKEEEPETLRTRDPQNQR